MRELKFIVHVAPPDFYFMFSPDYEGIEDITDIRTELKYRVFSRLWGNWRILLLFHKEWVLKSFSPDYEGIEAEPLLSTPSLFLRRKFSPDYEGIEVNGGDDHYYSSYEFSPDYEGIEV